MTRLGALAGMALLAGGAAPLPQAELVLNCYVSQSGDLGLGQFVRHLEIFPDRGIVSISDGVRGSPPQFVGNGRLVAFDAKRIVFEFASPRSGGRTEIDRASGALSYTGDRAAVRGSCQTSEL
ncbi:MAG: hypothetical protein M3N26_01635 [Pseudomonadota bacterium]|nr:hypothetical protein [Pseudomonadota bacterium]